MHLSFHFTDLKANLQKSYNNSLCLLEERDDFENGAQVVGVAQEIEPLTSKCETLSSNPSIAKIRKDNRTQ
jgi:hypothetical protein